MGSNSSFEQLRLEDELDEFTSKYTLCSDILDCFTVSKLYLTGLQVNNGQISNELIQSYIVELFQNEVVAAGKKNDYEEYLA